jgi:hypothetical protein
MTTRNSDADLRSLIGAGFARSEPVCFSEMSAVQRTGSFFLGILDTMD